MDNEDPCVPYRLCRINEDAGGLSPQLYTGVRLAGSVRSNGQTDPGDSGQSDVSAKIKGPNWPGVLGQRVILICSLGVNGSTLSRWIGSKDKTGVAEDSEPNV